MIKQRGNEKEIFLKPKMVLKIVKVESVGCLTISEAAQPIVQLNEELKQFDKAFLESGTKFLFP